MCCSRCPVWLNTIIKSTNKLFAGNLHPIKDAWSDARSPLQLEEANTPFKWNMVQILVSETCFAHKITFKVVSHWSSVNIRLGNLYRTDLSCLTRDRCTRTKRRVAVAWVRSRGVFCFSPVDFLIDELFWILQFFFPPGRNRSRIENKMS